MSAVLLALEQNREIRIVQNEMQAATHARKSAQTQYLPKVFRRGMVALVRAIQPLENDLLLPVVPFNTIDPATGRFNPEALKDPETAVNTLVINPENWGAHGRSGGESHLQELRDAAGR